ncbi:hypothetical protein BS47DRAFT_1399850 [Hydnum rufescens UP504]|uniref:Uncharacterized protein n=1 Tax=Hydnum rufescens UP504 TaxID=1448309 RepID=A0A9P6AHY7_9AGAM|nr:hypothetical protein BS47DRAFT_1399850 [Hydnum rufescens UP504]
MQPPFAHPNVNEDREARRPHSPRGRASTGDGAHVDQALFLDGDSVSDSTLTVREARARGELFFPAERGHNQWMQPPFAHPDVNEDREARHPHSPRGRASTGAHVDEALLLDGDSVSDSGSDMDPVKDAVSSQRPPDPNPEANLSSSHSFIQRSMVDNESDSDAVEKALGLPSPDSEAEVEAGADLDPALTSEDASPPFTTEHPASKAQTTFRKNNRS